MSDFVFYDRNSRRIYAGVSIRNIHDGSVDKVYATMNQYGQESLGVSATNPDFLVAHPEWPEEYFDLSQFDLSEWEIVTLPYSEVCSLFCQRENELAGRDVTEDGKTHLLAHIIVSADSFPDKSYSLESRTYEVSSNNKAYQPNMGGYSVFASSVDGSDPCIRLERYLAAEKGGKDGWKIDCCYLVEN